MVRSPLWKLLSAKYNELTWLAVSNHPERVSIPLRLKLSRRRVLLAEDHGALLEVERALWLPIMMSWG